MQLHQSFKLGAKKLAIAERAYSEIHKAHGIEESHWLVLTQKEPWTPDQMRAIRSILANVVEVSMTIAGIPAIPLPGQYVAAVIAEIVHPSNWMVAATKAPETFDASDASGLMGTSEVKEMSTQQMMALTLAYGGGYYDEPAQHRLPSEVEEKVIEANTSKRTKKVA